MSAAFGPRSAEVFAQDHVLSRLGNRTVNEALGAGVAPRTVWRAVYEEMTLPARLR
jgi:hypothetical protein